MPDLYNSILLWHQNSSGSNVEALKFLLPLLIPILIYYCYGLRDRKSVPQLPPGPRGLPLVGNLPFLDPELHTYFTCLAKTYGPIMKLRLGSKTLIVVNSSSLSEEVLKDNDVIFANRDASVASLVGTYDGRDIVFSPYGPEWRTLRKVCGQKMLNNTTLNSVYPLRRSMMRRAVKHIHNRSGEPLNIGDQIFNTAFNIVTNMIWGKTMKGQEVDRLGAEFREIVTEMALLGIKPNISDFYPVLARFDLQGIEKRNRALHSKFDRLFDRVIDERIKLDMEGSGGELGQDFLQYLLRLKEEEEGADGQDTPLTMIQLKALLLDMIAGGTETSSNSVEFAMTQMMMNPEIMQKAQQELDSVIGKDNIIEESHTHHLPYLKAVMKETLRLHPVLPLLVPHCPSDTCVIGGYTIPKGCQVIVNAWAIQRDPTAWRNPLKFDPERFLGNRKWDFTGTDLNYLPFGAGRRICPGIAMGERMVLYSLATLLHSFDWKLPEGTEKLDVTARFGIILKKKVPFVAVPTPRLHSPALYD